MFGHVKAQSVVRKMLKTLEEMVIPVKLQLFLGMDRPNINKAIMDKLNKI